MSSNNSDDEISRALDKLDKDSDAINAHKKKTQKLLDKGEQEQMNSPEERIKNEAKKQNQEFFQKLLLNGALGFGIFLIALLILSSFTQVQRIDTLEKLIIISLCVGMVAAKRR